MFEGNIEDQEECQFYPCSSSKMPLHTCNTLRHGTSVMSPNFNNPEGFSDSIDLSIDSHLYHHNASSLFQALTHYFQQCLNRHLQPADLSPDSTLFHFPSSQLLETQKNNDLEALILSNRLLHQTHKKQLLQNFKEYHELPALFAELQTILGSGLTEELLFLAQVILDRKLAGFRSRFGGQKEEQLLPKMERFWGEEEEERWGGSELKCFEEVEVEEVGQFGGKEVEQLATSAYFSGELRYLSLKEVGGEVREQVQVVDKFASFVIFFSKVLFLNLAGIAVPEREGEQFRAELSLETTELGQVSGTVSSKKVKQQ